MSIKHQLRALAIGTAIACATAPAFAYSVNNGKVLDDKGNQVQLRGVNWFGFETNNHVTHGLWARNWKDMISQMQRLGFNAVRLPFCPASLQASTSPSSINYQLNPDLQNLNSQQLMDKMIKEFSDRGMYVLLDHHTPDCSAISELWYTSNYSEAQWINDLKSVAQRYANVPGVIGIDLKNEPHGSATWGANNPATDWNTAAERAAAAVLAEAPKWLVGVEGINSAANCTGGSNHFWGENIEPLECKPLAIPANHLLLVPHVYGPDVYGQPYFNSPNFPDNLPAVWEQHFGRFVNKGYTLILGEYGGKYGQGDQRDVKVQNKLVDYLRSKGIHSGFYWSWNPNSGDTGGILRDDWQSVRDDKVFLLKSQWVNSDQPTTPTTPTPPTKPTTPTPPTKPITPTPPTEPTTPTPPAKPTTPTPPAKPTTPTPPAKPTTPVQPTTPPVSQGDGQFSVRKIVDTDWGAGYCNRFQVTNVGTTNANWSIQVQISGHPYTLWSGNWSQQGQTLTVSGMDWNRNLRPGAMAEFGFCANR